MNIVMPVKIKLSIFHIVWGTCNKKHILTDMLRSQILTLSKAINCMTCGSFKPTLDNQITNILRLPLF